MSSARDEVLGRIRDIMGGVRCPLGDDYARIPRHYRQSSTLGAAELVELFASRIVHYDGNVVKCGRAELPGAIASTLGARGVSGLHVPADIDRSWLPSEFTFTPDAGGPTSELDTSQGVLTGCSVAIALTGTIVLTHAAGEGRRALTLVPDYHLVVVFADQIVETVPEALARANATTPPLITTISGPSATSDIEMTRIKGVHGPRMLDVIIVI